MTSRWTLVALIGSLLLAILSQYVLCCHQESRWMGVGGYAVAVALFVAAVTVSRRSSRTLRPRHLPWTFLIVTMAAGLVVWAAYLAHVTPLARFNYE
ncbi:MAG: hypothetical protein KKC18_11300, partial [Chloroflexi bacterium]|nr:hypothetical protein [Chloroflexota bacterium]